MKMTKKERLFCEKETKELDKEIAEQLKKVPRRYHRRIKCVECSVNYVEKAGRICPGCEAYREHTGQI